jgi:hypothetical protein
MDAAPPSHAGWSSSPERIDDAGKFRRTGQVSGEFA